MPDIQHEQLHCRAHYMRKRRIEKSKPNIHNLQQPQRLRRTQPHLHIGHSMCGWIEGIITYWHMHIQHGIHWMYTNIIRTTSNNIGGYEPGPLSSFVVLLCLLSLPATAWYTLDVYKYEPHPLYVEYEPDSLSSFYLCQLQTSAAEICWVCCE